MIKRLGLLVALITLAAAIGGCSTVNKDQFMALQSMVMENQRRIGDMDKRLTEVDKNMELSRKPQAELVSEITSIRQELAMLRGQSEETRHYLEGIQGDDRLEQMSQDYAKVREASDARIKRLEGLLGIGPDGKKTAAAKEKTSAKPATTKKLTPKELYNKAYGLYQKKKYTAAKALWEQVAQKYPKNRYAPPSQFWVGQSYFAMKKYEEAILAYNQVIKRYPKHDKVASSLLKQGMAFQALGDKRTAKIVLKKLVAKYPKTEQARIAKSRLSKL